MAEDGSYSLVELFVLKFVLADVVIIFALLLAGPLYAVAITALFVLSFLLLWYLTRDDEPVDESPTDPVTALQRRYADGELTEAEFEARLETLIESNERASEAGVDTAALDLERR